MNYIAVRGKGDQNKENGKYKNSIGLLYAVAFTIKMSYKGNISNVLRHQFIVTLNLVVTL